MEAIVKCSACQDWVRSQFDLQHSVIPLVRMLWVRTAGQSVRCRRSATTESVSCVAHLSEFARLIAEVGIARPFTQARDAHFRIQTRADIPAPVGQSGTTPSERQSIDDVDRAWIAAFAVLPGVPASEQKSTCFPVIMDIRQSLLMASHRIAKAGELLEGVGDSGQVQVGARSKATAIPAAFWQLFIAETCLLDCHRQLCKPQFTHALTETDLRFLHAGGQKLLMARVQLWKLDEAELLLQPELTLLGWERPSGDLRRAAVVATLELLDSGAFMRVCDAIPREQFLDPFWSDPALQTALERLEARWFKRTCSDMLTEFKKRESRLSVPGRPIGAAERTMPERRVNLRSDGDRYASKVLSLAQGFTITQAGCFMLAVAWAVMFAVLMGKVREPSRVLICSYVLIQGLLLLSWIMRRELRLHLPRAFFGTGFIWLLSLLPLMEVIRNVNVLAIPPHLYDDSKAKRDYSLLLLTDGPCSREFWGISLLGLGFGIALILMQVRGPRPAGHSSIAEIVTTLTRQCRRTWKTKGAECRDLWSAMHGPRRAWKDLLTAVRVTVRSVIGAIWWGTIVLFSLTAFEPTLGDDRMKLQWSIIPLSIWAVGLAFVSQLMWQDQYLTEPLSSDR